MINDKHRQVSFPLIAAFDGGGTKTAFRLYDAQSGEILLDQKSGPGNISFPLETLQESLEPLWDSLSPYDPNHIQAVYAMAGSGSQSNINKLNSISPKFGTCHIISDGLAALLGTHAGKPGSMVISGTGSIAFRLLDDYQIVQAGGWGFRLGDEGSAADVGRKAVQWAMAEFDRHRGEIRQFEILAQKIFTHLGSSRSGLIAWLLQASPSDFGSLASLVVHEIPHSTVARSIIEQAAADIGRLYHVLDPSLQSPLCLYGGFSEILRPYLPSLIQDRIQEPVADALYGAFLYGRDNLNLKLKGMAHL